MLPQEIRDVAGGARVLRRGSAGDFGNTRWLGASPQRPGPAPGWPVVRRGAHAAGWPVVRRGGHAVGWPAVPLSADGVGMLAGYALDAVLGDPARWHPVAGFGTAAGALERLLYRPHRLAGTAFTVVAVGVPVLAGAAGSVLTRRRPVLRAVLVAAATWTVLGGRTLRREARFMGGHLAGGEVDAARGRLSHLCGRDPSALDEPELARATVESVAENTSDAVVAPLFWGGVAGLPGLLGYRAANTLDAMVGHRSAHYARFGTPSARLDDALNLVPARLTGLLTVAAAPLAGGRPGEALRVFRRDRDDHPSPNAGQCESAMAGALGVRLGGRNVYFGRAETRPFLGDGPRPGARHPRRAARISAAVGVAAVVVAAGLAQARSRADARGAPSEPPPAPSSQRPPSAPQAVPPSTSSSPPAPAVAPPAPAVAPPGGPDGR